MRATDQLRNIDWRATAIVNFQRCVAAPSVWFVISLFAWLGGAEDMMPWAFLLAPLVFPFFFPVSYACAWMSSKGVPFIGWVAKAIWLFFVVGDPLMYTLHKRRPDLVPVAEYGFFNGAPLILVMRADLISAAGHR